MSSALFREAALQSRHRKQQDGEGSGVPPPAHWLIGLGALLLILAIMALLFFGTYTASERVRGYLQPEAGTVQVFTPRPGVIDSVLVHNGDRINRGMTLLRVSAHRKNYGASVDAQLIAALEAEFAGVAGQLERLPLRQQRERKALAAARDANEKELGFLSKQLALNDADLEQDAEQQLALAHLADGGHVAASELQRQAAAGRLLEQRRAELSREIVRVQGEFAQADANSQALPLRQQDERAVLFATQLRLARELAAARGAAAFSIEAPVNGIVSGLTRRRGDAVRSNTPLLTIVPEGANYCAILLVPSRAIGFIAPGDSVRVRVDAYPFQKFGVITGEIAAISLTASSPGGQTAPVPIAEPVFRVRVMLDAQVLKVGNDLLPFAPDMTVVAEVRRDKRRIVEWLIAPLISFAGVS